MPIRGITLPVVYHENILRLMVQEPDTVFAYWDLSPGHIQAISGHEELFLCLYKESQLDQKVGLPPFTNNWYFRQVEPGRAYYCELGFQNPEGTFIFLLRSNQVNTPRLVPVEEEGWETGLVTVDVATLPPRERKIQKGDTPSSTVFYEV
jgi:hypothetical protein